MIKNSGSTFLAVFLRSYSRRTAEGKRETWEQCVNRSLDGLNRLGNYTPEQLELIRAKMSNLEALPSGRWMWIGGTEWVENPENFIGAYNCTSVNLDDPGMFGLLMSMAMQGTGTGAVLEPKYINKLPTVKRLLNVTVKGSFGTFSPGQENTTIETLTDGTKVITIGDSRQGWVEAYQSVIDAAMQPSEADTASTKIIVDISHVRPKGAKLKGFGGIANPSALPELFPRMEKILNGCANRDGRLSAVECCKLIDEAAKVVVAGNIRRSAGMRQGASTDLEFAQAKDNLWQQSDDGSWKIDPDRDCLRMANHTRVYHSRPSQEEITKSVTTQFYSGEGAIQFVPEAIARANADILNSTQKQKFIDRYCKNGPDDAKNMLIVEGETERMLQHRIQRYGMNPCGEILGSDFLCNLSEIHLKTHDPYDIDSQIESFRVGGLICAALLKHQFKTERQQFSREFDPIVGVSFTGLFDFFATRFGLTWLKWWEAGRPSQWEYKVDVLTVINSLPPDWQNELHAVYRDIVTLGEVYNWVERKYLETWKIAAEAGVYEYCDQHGLKRPNRCTTVQPAGSKSLLTDSSPGWHPPKGAFYIRRITYAAGEPLALALKDLGYNVIPGQSDKDENGNLLTDINDPRVTEWLVEFPVQTSAGKIPGSETIDFSRFSAVAQLDFYMNVQNYYTAHNTSATIELRENEIEEFSNELYERIGKGFVSAALLARYDAPFPRLPFQVITPEEYRHEAKQVLLRSKITPDQFHQQLDYYDNPENNLEGPAQCDSAACLV